MKIYKVGGCVRDLLLGFDAKDIDYVVVGATEDDMLKLGYEQVGKDFPVFLHPETGDEYALARTERKTGAGYNGFSVETTNVTLEDDLFRRDLTINAMAMDEHGNFIDPYNGQEDLKNGILRHVSEHFKEDPVRILRIARFSARYNFKIADTTMAMMKEMVDNGEFDSLTPERVWKEFEKALGEPHIKNFFDNLEQIGALQKIPGFSQIQEKDFFDVIKNYPDQHSTLNLLHVFSQMDDKVLKKWKMPSEEYQKIKTFGSWKHKECFYSYMSIDEKIEYMQTTKAIHMADNAKEMLKHICVYQSWKQDKQPDFEKELASFEHDLGLLKAIDYSSIVNDALAKKENPAKATYEARIQALQPQRKLKLI